MCLWMFLDKQAVGVELGEVVVQGGVDGHEHHDIGSAGGDGE